MASINELDNYEVGEWGDFVLLTGKDKDFKIITGDIVAEPPSLRKIGVRKFEFKRNNCTFRAFQYLGSKYVIVKRIT